VPLCEQCDRPFGQVSRGRPRRFCLSCRPRVREIQPHAPADPRPRLCATCEQPSYGARCSVCARAAGLIRSLDDYRTLRRQRERAAPGLSSHARSKLLHTWKRKRARCTYCPSLATTVDHVVPLVRGGTNHEGNLTPCCRPCNSSKSGLLVSEWRTGIRLPPMTNPPAWATIIAAPKAKPLCPSVQLELRPCVACGSLGLNMRCGDPECFKVEMRNRYRARVGIPLDAPLYTRTPILSA
jgi:5-methylcytosine-specific restriction endonuclease McrA